MRAARGNLDDLTAQRTDKIAILPLGVDDDNIVVGRERDAGNGILHADRFAAARYAEIKSVGRDQPLAVANEQVFADGVDAIADAACVLNLLRAKRHEDRRTLGRQRPQRLDPAQTVRQDGIQAVLLLVVKRGKMAGVLPPNRAQRLRVGVELFERIGNMNERHDGEHHALVAHGEIVQILLGLCAQLLQLIGDRRGKVVFIVLPLLPARNVRLDAEDTALYLAYRLVRGDRQNVDGEDKAARNGGEVRDHIVAEIAAEILEEQDAAELVPHLKIAVAETQPIRADQVAEIHAAPEYRRLFIRKQLLLAGAKEVMQQP